MDTQLSPTNALEREIHTCMCHTCLVLGMRLRSSQYLLSPLEYANREKKWLRALVLIP